MTQAYPLQWPSGWKRTKYRAESRFHRNRQPLSMYEAQARLHIEIRHLRAQRAIISTNQVLNQDGSIRSRQREPEDVGAALYWRLQADQPDRVIAIDIYNRLEDNIAAIAAVLESLRRVERHGGKVATEQIFQGLALPSPDHKKDWRELLGAESGDDQRAVKLKWRKLASRHHTDTGAESNAVDLGDINVAWQEAKKYFETNERA